MFIIEFHEFIFYFASRRLIVAIINFEKQFWSEID